MTKQPHLIVGFIKAEKRDQLIREALQSEPISMYPDFIAAVGAALDDLDRFRSERSFIVGCNEGFEAAIDQAARLIEEYSIMDTSGGKELSPRIDGNREGLHYAISIRALVAGNKAPAPTATSKVKPLDWKAFNEGFGHGRIYYGTGVFGHWYAVSRLKAGLWHCVHHVGEPAHLPFTRSLDEAKAAAQADYESRIIAALAPAPRAEGGD